MLELEKRVNGNGYDNFYIHTDDGTFEISYQGVLDLFWRFICPVRMLDSLAQYSVSITKENMYLYSLFDTLYDGIKNDRFFGEERPYLAREIDGGKSSLFHDGVIEWHSDDNVYERASCVCIRKLDGEYEITFKKSKAETSRGEFFTFGVRFSTSGSRYGSYFIPFMKMYEALGKYPFGYHQIHMEEYLYEKSRQKGKEKRLSK